MSRKDGGNPNEGPNSGSSRQNPLYGARALLSRHLTSGATPSPGRLPSLRPARDLTLGASPRLNLGGNPKRTFAPNIPTRRIKQEPKDGPSDTPETLGEKKRRDNRGARGRGRGRGERGKPEIIQCSSIFSMGAGPDRQKMGSSASSYSNIGGRDNISSVKVKKERNDDIDGSDESKLVLEMLKTSGDFEENMEQGGAMPVQLPLTSHAIKKEEKEVETESMTDVKVKIEPLDVEMENAEKPLIEKKCKPLKGTAVKKEKTMDPTVLSLLNSLSPGNEKLLFFQFPDVLPMNPAAGSQDEPMVVDQQSNQQTPTKTTGGPKLSLRDASEGYIGKLQLRRSGKARLLFGQVSLDVSMGTPCGFLQDVVSVHTEENRSDMITIGHVQNRLICTPEFEHLLAS